MVVKLQHFSSERDIHGGACVIIFLWLFCGWIKNVIVRKKEANI